MTKLDHLAIYVGDRRTATHWYTSHLGLSIEREQSNPGVTAVRDDADFTIFLTENAAHASASACILYFQVGDVDVTFATLSRQGVAFSHPPRSNPWGYGAQLLDPDGHVVRLWDQQSMSSRPS